LLFKIHRPASSPMMWKPSSWKSYRCWIKTSTNSYKMLNRPGLSLSRFKPCSLEISSQKCFRSLLLKIDSLWSKKLRTGSMKGSIRRNLRQGESGQ
jgi:hypothetical protein